VCSHHHQHVSDMPMATRTEASFSALSVSLSLATFAKPPVLRLESRDSLRLTTSLPPVLLTITSLLLQLQLSDCVLPGIAAPPQYMFGFSLFRSAISSHSHSFCFSSIRSTNGPRMPIPVRHTIVYIDHSSSQPKSSSFLNCTSMNSHSHHKRNHHAMHITSVKRVIFATLSIHLTPG